MEELSDFLREWVPLVSGITIATGLYIGTYYLGGKLGEYRRKRRLEKERRRIDNLDSGYYLHKEADFEASHKRYDEDVNSIEKMLKG